MVKQKRSQIVKAPRNIDALIPKILKKTKSR